MNRQSQDNEVFLFKDNRAYEIKSKLNKIDMAHFGNFSKVIKKINIFFVKKHSGQRNYDLHVDSGLDYKSITYV